MRSRAYYSRALEPRGRPEEEVRRGLRILVLLLLVLAREQRIRAGAAGRADAEVIHQHVRKALQDGVAVGGVDALAATRPRRSVVGSGAGPEHSPAHEYAVRRVGDVLFDVGLLGVGIGVVAPGEEVRAGAAKVWNGGLLVDVAGVVIG